MIWLLVVVTGWCNQDQFSFSLRCDADYEGDYCQIEG